mmetsp:Transcript_29000/g.90734  ORF Transcript_29000/g.90734 Transcript_29000/m.90734 type:complete len:204 (+) Transcript_29000:51-662(+)
MPSPLKTHDRVSSRTTRRFSSSVVVGLRHCAPETHAHGPDASLSRSKQAPRLACALAQTDCAETELAARLALLLGVALLAAVEVAVLVVVVVVVRRRLHRARARHNVQADGTRQRPIAVLLHPRSQPHERLALLALLGEGSFTGGSVTRRQRKLQLHLANLALAPLDGAPCQTSPLAAVSEPTQAPRRPERIGGGLGRRERAP